MVDALEPMSADPKGAVRALRDVDLADASSVGGKAASLGALAASGHDVPDGIVLAVGWAALAPDERVASLAEGVRDLGVGPFAVRSSAPSEDGAERSFAGVFASVLDVPVDGLGAAIEEVLASASSQRADAYRRPDDGIAVIVQRMVPAVAAGVALTADPITGDRGTAIVTAVHGTGERLVSGASTGDEWVIGRGKPVARRRPERAIDAGLASRVAAAARRIAAERGMPQDVEWAIDQSDRVWILQARPMTALPPEASWSSPARGAFTRQLRFGEWIGEPVTPLFESWLLPLLESGLHGTLHRWTGQAAPEPHHVIVNGWYFYSLNWLSPSASIRYAPSLLRHAIREPRRVAGMFPPTARHSVPVFEREWRTELQPRYRTAVARAAARVEAADAGDLPTLVDELGGAAGEYFASVAALAGAAYKLEMNLSQFYRRHLEPRLGGTHLELLAGLDVPTDGPGFALASLDWWDEPVRIEAGIPADRRSRLVAERTSAETAAFAALAGSRRRADAFRRLLGEAQRLVPIREEQVAEFTLPWPTMRRAVVRIGEALVARGALRHADDVFFLTRTEVVEVLAGRATATIDVDTRRRLRADQAKLVPPLLVGRMGPVLSRLWAMFPALVGARRSETSIVSGSPASPGRATGPVRVVRGPADFGRLLPGEVLVAPLTAPAWTPLFHRAVAVVTDVGSAAAHASIIAREYGLPAVVGCGDATVRLRDGMIVTVDGSTGNVEPGPPGWSREPAG